MPTPPQIGGLDAVERDELFDLLRLHFTGRPGLAPASWMLLGSFWPAFSLLWSLPDGRSISRVTA